MKEFSVRGRIIRTTAIYYRLLLQNLLKNEKKTFYFDCDTLIYKDLTEVYNFNITDNYYVGAYEGLPLFQYRNKKKLKNFINSGVILINLENLRKDNIYEKIIKFLKENNNRLSYLDQDAINVVCNNKNGFFPAHYVSSGNCDFTNIIKLYSSQKNEKLRNFIKSESEPYIFHFIGLSKPWHGITNKNGIVCFDHISRFYEYARKSYYYYVILNTFKVRYTHR